MFGNKEAEAMLAEAKRFREEAEKTKAESKARLAAAEAMTAQADAKMAEAAEAAAGVDSLIAENARKEKGLKALEAELEARVAGVLEQQSLINKAFLILVTGGVPEEKISPEEAAAWLIEQMRRWPNPPDNLGDLTDAARAVVAAAFKLRQQSARLDGTNSMIDAANERISEAAKRLNTKLAELRDLNDRFRSIGEDILKTKTDIAARDRTLGDEKAELKLREDQLAECRRKTGEVSAAISRAAAKLNELVNAQARKERELSQAMEDQQSELAVTEEQLGIFKEFIAGEVARIREERTMTDHAREDALADLERFGQEARLVVEEAMERTIKEITGLSTKLSQDTRSNVGLIESLLSGMKHRPTLIPFFAPPEEKGGRGDSEPPPDDSQSGDDDTRGNG